MVKERKGHNSKCESSRQFKLVSKTSEGKKPVFGGAFNLLDSRYLDLFASVAGNRVAVYRCQYGEPTERLQLYKDEDDSECFYTVAWLSGTEGAPLLAASGSSGVIRVIDTAQQAVIHSLLGHGGSVNELRVHPREPHLFISGSKDESLRLWNGVTALCALVLGGARGHRNEVLSADFHPQDKGIVASCGMDSTIRIWSLHHWWDTVELTKTWKRTDGTFGSSFPSKIIQYPIIVVQKVHTNYVDCLRFFGNFFLTKSVDNEVAMWRWCAKNEASGAAEGFVDILAKLHVPDCDIWFLKFAMDGSNTTMAVGSRNGHTFVWDMAATPPVQVSHFHTKECKSAVRQTAVSYCGRTIMCCCDDGSVWRWEKNQKNNGN